MFCTEALPSPTHPEGDLDLRVPRLAYFATRDIKPFEELFIDYYYVPGTVAGVNYDRTLYALYLQRFTMQTSFVVRTIIACCKSYYLYNLYN